MTAPIGPGADAVRVSVTNCIFTARPGRLQVLLTRSATTTEPTWRLPGGLIERGERLDAAAARVLEVRTGVRGVYLEQLYTFDCAARGDLDLSVAYFSLVPATVLHPCSEGEGVRFWDADSPPPVVASGHGDVIAYARQRLAAKVQYTNCAWSLLPDKFTLSELQVAYETVLARELDKRNFRKKVLSLGLLSPLGEKSATGRHRPAMLYRFRSVQPELVQVL